MVRAAREGDGQRDGAGYMAGRRVDPRDRHRCAVNHKGPITGRFLISTMLRPYLIYHHDNPTETHTGQDSTLSTGGGAMGPRGGDLEGMTENGEEFC